MSEIVGKLCEVSVGTEISVTTQTSRVSIFHRLNETFASFRGSGPGYKVSKNIRNEKLSP